MACERRKLVLYWQRVRTARSFRNACMLTLDGIQHFSKRWPHCMVMVGSTHSVHYDPKNYKTGRMCTKLHSKWLSRVLRSSHRYRKVDGYAHISNAVPVAWEPSK